MAGSGGGCLGAAEADRLHPAWSDLRNLACGFAVTSVVEGPARDSRSRPHCGHPSARDVEAQSLASKKLVVQCANAKQADTSVPLWCPT